MKKLLTVILTAILLTACNTVTPTPLDLEGIYGGYLTYQGSAFAAVAIDVSTVDGRVSGYGLAEDAYGYQVALNVSGNTTTSGGIDLRLTDIYGDYFRLTGSENGVALTGQWTVNFSSHSGSFRIVHEDDLGYLSLSDTTHEGGSLDRLLPF